MTQVLLAAHPSANLSHPQAIPAHMAYRIGPGPKLLGMRLPPQLRGEMAGYVTGSLLTEEEAKLLKAADRLSALIKCTEEVQAGNREFAAALTQQRAALKEMNCPEADYFIVHMLPCYAQPLDELTGQGAD